MAKEENAHPRNAPGVVYVDKIACIDCILCQVEVPTVFARDNDGDGKTFVRKQPETQKEIAGVENTIRSCPTEAVGKRMQTVVKFPPGMMTKTDQIK